jgi:putative transposase
MEPSKPYPTGLSDREWALIQHLVSTAKAAGRAETYPERDILDAIFDVLRGGCAWCLLPHDFPPWPIVYHDFWRWLQDGTWQVIHDLLGGDVCAGHRQTPST